MPTPPITVVLFGATGDLAKRKLLPGLLHLFQTGLLRDLQVVGTSLDEHDRDSFVDFARGAIDEFAAYEVKEEDWTEFEKRLLVGALGDRARRAARPSSTRPTRRPAATGRATGCTT